MVPVKILFTHRSSSSLHYQSQMTLSTVIVLLDETCIPHHRQEEGNGIKRNLLIMHDDEIKAKMHYAKPPDAVGKQTW